MPSPLPSGRASLAPEATRFLQRARILDATARVVAEAGYAETSIQDIQTRAGVSKRTFYEHFANKQDAVLWAQDAAATYAVPRVLSAFCAQDGWVAGVSAALETYLRLLDCDAAWAALYLIELPMLGGEAMARRARLLAPLLEALRTRVPAEGQTPLTVATVLAAVDGVLRAGVAHRSRSVRGLVDLRPQLVYLAIAPFVGPEQARRQAEGPALAVRPAGEPRRAARVAELCERLDDDPGSVTELEALVTESAAAGDGPALWRAVTALHRRRGDGRPVPTQVEHRALAGLARASFFGLSLQEAAGGVSAWAIPTPAQRVLSYVAAHPGVSGEDVRRALGFGHLSQVSRLLAALEADGELVRGRGRGHANAWRVATGRASLGDAKDDDA
jgi:AcrR family transcriptional regulator